ncbi:hypothetical protein BpHYR1_002374 [Brachionus plicatilis]
MGLPY